MFVKHYAPNYKDRQLNDMFWTKYSRASMARAYLGQRKLVRDMGSSSLKGLIMEPGQEI